MNHFKISIIKSIIRIVSSIVSLIVLFINIPVSVIVLAGGYGLAEILGILEEIFDKRKEK